MQEMQIVLDVERDETRLLPVIEPELIPVTGERERGDNWFVLFSSDREKPVVVPLGKNQREFILTGTFFMFFCCFFFYLKRDLSV